MVSRMAQRIQEIPLANWVTPQKTNAIAAEVVRQCDEMDGRVDGIINNYVACRANFDVTEGAVSNPWDSKRCPDGIDPNPADNSAAACLTDGQIETVQFTHKRYKYATPLAYGTKDFGMYVPNTSPNADGTIQSQRFKSQEGAAPDASIWTWGAYEFIAGGIYKDLTADTLEYVEGGPLNERRKLLSEWLDSTNPNLNPFRAKGGKLIAIVGAYDTRASSGEQLDYYESVLERMGERKVRDFARLYVIPNAGHGLSGRRYGVDGNGNPTSGEAVPSNGRPDIETLIAWVEQGVAPGDNPVLTSNNGASLPLCEYPAYPRFDGVGDPANAASYSCQEN
jgi:feruloyl esterase